MKRKGWKRKIISFLAVIVATLAMNESTVFANEDIVCGADIGWMSQMEDGGVTWVDDDGVTTDPLPEYYLYERHRMPESGRSLYLCYP